MISETSSDLTKHDFKKKWSIAPVACENLRKNESDENRKPQPKLLPDVYNVSVYNHKLRETKYT